MKKALIPALLIVSATLASSLPWQFAFPARVSEVAGAVAGPLARALFWQLCDELLTRHFALWTGNVPGEPEDHCASMSIPLYLVRRTVEREFTSVHEYSANHRRVLQYQVNDQFKEMSS